MTDDRSGQDYYAQREAQERALAQRALDPTARRIHLELANRYAEQLRMPMPSAA